MTAIATRRVLIVARYFPPSGGAPSIRMTKLVKYLGQFGWEPEVVTVPASHRWEADEVLMSELPPGIRIHRVPRLLAGAAPPEAHALHAARELRPSRRQRLAATVLVPDASLLWALPVARQLRLLIAGVDALLTTAPPFSTHLIPLLAGVRSMPWVADYRDNWTSNPEFRGAGPIAVINRRLERAVLRRADGITAVSQAAADELAGISPSSRGRISVAMNGFDEDDMPPPQPGSGRSFRLTYAGSMRASRDPSALIAALQQASEGDPGFRAALELELFGSIPESVVREAVAALGADRVTVHGFVPHARALEGAAAASVLVAISSEAEAGRSTMTSKLVEYLGLRRPILFLAPPGPGADLVRRLGAGETASPDDTAEIRAAVDRLYRRWRSGDERVVDAALLTPLTRRETARVVAQALDAAVRRRANISRSAG